MQSKFGGEHRRNLERVVPSIIVDNDRRQERFKEGGLRRVGKLRRKGTREFA